MLHVFAMPSVDLKDAVKKATEYFSDLLFVHNVRLEEVELNEDGRFWSITLSGLVNRPSKTIGPPLTVGALNEYLNPDVERIYKIFVVSAEDGTVRSMKIRPAQ